MESNYNPFSNTPEGENQNNYTPYGSQQFGYQPKKPVNYFETASMVLGIISILACTFIYASYICGALAILFAFLSRGGQMKMSTKAKLGVFLGIAAIVLSTVVFIGAFLILLEEYGSIEGILRAYSEMSGLDFEAEFGDLFQ